ncbi:MAG: DUF805 domain-containing protein [Pseudomonadota bacterium]
MTFSVAVQTCLTKFLMLTGRASRPEYWWFYLFALIVTAIASIVDGLIFGFPNEGEVGQNPITMVASFIVFWPLLAAGWRRMHDTGRPGWLVLLPLLVFIAGFAFFLITIGIFGEFGHVANETSEEMVQTDRVISVFMIFLIIAAMLAAGIVKLVMLIKPGETGPNEYGPPPPR